MKEKVGLNHVELSAWSEHLIEKMLMEILTEIVIGHWVGGDSMVARVRAEAESIAVGLMPAMRAKLCSRLPYIAKTVVTDWIAIELGNHTIEEGE